MTNNFLKNEIYNTKSISRVIKTLTGCPHHIGLVSFFDNCTTHNKTCHDCWINALKHAPDKIELVINSK